MRASENAYKLIKKYEGLHLTAYKCPANVWTIGYGHTSGVAPHSTIDRETAESLLKEDVKKCEKIVSLADDVYGLKLNQNEYDSLISFVFNCGALNLDNLVANRTKEVISAKILLYVNAGNVKLNGLVKRREEEKLLFDTPVTEDNTASEYYYISFPKWNHCRLFAADSLDSDVIGWADETDFIGVFADDGDWLSTDQGWIYKKELFAE